MKPRAAPSLANFGQSRHVLRPIRGGLSLHTTGSATTEAHLMRAVGDDDTLVEAYGAAHLATVRAGDSVTYDASVLHYGTANAVEGNDRMVLYFSVARAGAAAASFAVAGEESPEWLVAVDPIPLSSYAE